MDSTATVQQKRKRWGSEQGRQVITYAFTFLQLSDIPKIRRVCVAWWRASQAREIWVSIANSNFSSSSSSASSMVFGVRDVESILKDVILSSRNHQQQQIANQDLQTTQTEDFESNNNNNNNLPRWLPAGSQIPSWLPQPPPRSNGRRIDNNIVSQQQQRTSDQIHFREITNARQNQREAQAGGRSNHHHHQDENQLRPRILSLKEQLDEIARSVLNKLHLPPNTPHTNLLSWQRGEILETQINALRFRAKQLLASSFGSTTSNSNSSTSMEHRVALLEKRQSDSNQLAINTKIENQQVEDLAKYSRRVFKVMELQNAQRRLVFEFERKVVRLCTKFADSNNSSSSELSTFFDLEMACLAPGRIGTKLYTNWSSMKRAFPIDDIYFEAVDVLLSSSTSFANTSGVEYIVACDEADSVLPSEETNSRDDDYFQKLCDGISLSSRKDFLLLLRKSCLECLKRSSSSSMVSLETHTLIIDTMIAFVYAAKMTMDGSFSEEMKNQANAKNVNEKGHPMTPVIPQAKSWKEVLELVDRAKNYASAVLAV